MKSEAEQKFREHIVIQLAEHSTSIKNIHKNTERILNHLDTLNGRVRKNENSINFLQGVSTFIFVSLSLFISLVAYLK